MDNRVLDVVYEQVHKEITTAMQTGEFWTIWSSMTKWQERTIIGEA